mmetsp:Transcript_1564/g.3606  ORF Transcript_1564/g.3606 Transcript_1564/m.3606 type:complete len:777 (+) Transcript_1564:150-2480(+)
MSSPVRRSPRRRGGAHSNNNNSNSADLETEKTSPLSGSSLWNSPPNRRTRSPKRTSAAAAAADRINTSSSDINKNDNNADERKLFDTTNPDQSSLALQSQSNDYSPLVPTVGRSSSFRLDPRVSRGTRRPSLFETSLGGEKDGGNKYLSPFLSEENSADPLSKSTEAIIPAKKAAATKPAPYKSMLRSQHYNPHDLTDYTLTPTILYSNGMGNPPTSQQNRYSQQYHQSPHWSGKVRINPFSPVPERFLRPPSSVNSTKSLPVMNDSRPALLLSADSPKASGTRKSRRLKPKNVTFPPNIMEQHQVDDQTLEEFNDRISPTDVMQGTFSIMAHGKGTEYAGSKRKAEELSALPQSVADAEEWKELSNKRMRLDRGRYLEDFEEVSHLGSGSFGSVNACLSRLDGCMYAVKSIHPNGIQKPANVNNSGYNGVGVKWGGVPPSKGVFLYNSLQNSPRRNVMPSPLRRKKPLSRFPMDDNEDANGAGKREDIRGSSHWTDSALRRLLREVFALAALCNQADIRTFHIVRYHQAWFEDNGTLFIQTELCSATLRDEMTGKLKDEKSDGGTHVSPPIDENPAATRAIDVSRQFKCLREILLALELVHEKGMVHLDIKPENIFTKNGLYKLGDFGLAHVLTKEGHTNSDVEEGDSRYMPKDLLNGSPSDLTKCDIFSLGATMYEVCLNKPLPICGKEWHDLREGKLSSLPGTLPCLYTIIREMMHPNPDKRPSATDLLSRKELSCESDNLFLFGRNTMSSYKVCLTKKSSQAALKRSRSWEL